MRVLGVPTLLLAALMMMPCTATAAGDDDGSTATFDSVFGGVNWSVDGDPRAETPASASHGFTLGPGSYFVTVSIDGEPSTGPDIRNGVAGQRMTVDDGETLDCMVTLTAGAQLTGATLECGRYSYGDSNGYHNATMVISDLKGTGTITPTDPTVKTHTLTFDSKGGTPVASQTVTDGRTPSKPSDPTRDGFTFAGWYTDDDSFNDEFDFNRPLTTDVTVYAKWMSDAVSAACVPVTGAPASDWVWPAAGGAVGLMGVAFGFAPRRRRRRA